MELSRAISIVRELANGINPVTGESFPSDSPHHHPDTIRALFVVLEQVRSRRSQASKQRPTNPLPALEEVELTPEQQLAYERLRDWRRRKASEEGIASYMILHNSQMKQIVAMPATGTNDLLAIKGFGDKRVQRYGDEILAVVYEGFSSREEIPVPSPKGDN